MNWIPLTDRAQLDELLDASRKKPVVIFKHSTRCSISAMAKGRLERGTLPENADYYYLDLLQFRNISNAVAEKFSVEHESPQIIVLRDGACVYDESHNGITVEELTEILA